MFLQLFKIIIIHIAHPLEATTSKDAQERGDKHD